MKRIAFIPMLLFSCLLSAQALKGRIKIDAERSNGEIDSLLYGNFTEHLGRARPTAQRLFTMYAGRTWPMPACPIESGG